MQRSIIKYKDKYWYLKSISNNDVVTIQRGTTVETLDFKVVEPLIISLDEIWLTKGTLCEFECMDSNNCYQHYEIVQTTQDINLTILFQDFLVADGEPEEFLNYLYKERLVRDSTSDIRKIMFANEANKPELRLV